MDYAPRGRTEGAAAFICSGQEDATVSDGSAGARIAEPRTTAIAARAALIPMIERSDRRMMISPGRGEYRMRKRWRDQGGWRLSSKILVVCRFGAGR